MSTIFATILAMATVAVGDAQAASTPANPRATALCGAGDQPETGMQGETPLSDVATGRNRKSYFCGVRIVATIDPFDGGTSGFVTRSRTCAYVHGTGAKGAGLAVIDLSDPKHPKAVDLLTGPGAAGASETVDVVDAGDLHLLAAGDYGGGLEPPGPAPLDLYDTTDCRHPRHIATFWWPANVHTLKFTPDGKRIYAGRQFGTAGVMIVDVSNPQAPKYLGDYPLILPGGRQQRCHDVSFDAAQTRMYCAGSVPTIEARKDDSAPSIWDITLVGKTSVGPTGAWPAIRFVGTSATRGQGDHHAPLAKINGRAYMVAANELRCTAYPRVFDISDERNLIAVGDFKLEATDRCLTDPEWAKANAAGGYGLHYNSVVDNAWGKAVFGMFNFMGSGIRIVDLKDPAHPRELAYYHPGVPAGGRNFGPNSGGPGAREPISDSCVSHDWFVHETGQIWFGCRSGLYIAELSDAVKAELLRDSVVH